MTIQTETVNFEELEKEQGDNFHEYCQVNLNVWPSYMIAIGLPVFGRIEKEFYTVGETRAAAKELQSDDRLKGLSLEVTRSISELKENGRCIHISDVTF